MFKSKVAALGHGLEIPAITACNGSEGEDMLLLTGVDEFLVSARDTE